MFQAVECVVAPRTTLAPAAAAGLKIQSTEISAARVDAISTARISDRWATTEMCDVYPDLVSLEEIARRLHYARYTIYKWSRGRHVKSVCCAFPRPLYPARPNDHADLWDWRLVEAWHDHTHPGASRRRRLTS